MASMVVDFQHHYTPRALMKGGGNDVSARLDENGNPNYLLNPLLADIDAHVRMMDRAGIDAAVSANGWHVVRVWEDEGPDAAADHIALKMGASERKRDCGSSVSWASQIDGSKRAYLG